AQPLLPVPAARRPGLRPGCRAPVARPAEATAALRGAGMMRRPLVRTHRLLAALLLTLALAGCERVMRDMYDQPKRGSDEASALFPDGRATREPPHGSVPRVLGTLAAISSGRHGAEAVDAAASAAARQALPRPIP